MHAMPRPAPRVAPATTATLPRRGFMGSSSISSLLIVLGHPLPLQVLVEPVQDVLQPLYAVLGLAGARELVRLTRKEDQHRWLLLHLEGAEHRLRTLPR